MSDMRAIRSLGTPYFAFSTTEDTGLGSGVLPAFGVVEMIVEARIDDTPPMYLSGDEIHPLLALHDTDYTASAKFNYAAVGVTPNRAIKAVLTDSGLNVSEVSTVSGYIGRTTGWMTLHVTYDTGTGDIVLTVDDVPFYGTASGIMEPPAGRVGKVSLFNGADAYARVYGRIRRAYMGWFGTGPESAEWKIDSAAETLVPETVGLSGVSLSLSPQRRDFSLLPKPWGASPGAVVGDAWEWAYDLNYTRRVIHAPQYIRTRV